MQKQIKYVIEGLIWSGAGTLLTLLFDKDYVVWETMVLWFLIGVGWKYWMDHPFKSKSK